MGVGEGVDVLVGFGVGLFVGFGVGDSVGIGLFVSAISTVLLRISASLSLVEAIIIVAGKNPKINPNKKNFPKPFIFKEDYIKKPLLLPFLLKLPL